MEGKRPERKNISFRDERASKIEVDEAQEAKEDERSGEGKSDSYENYLKGSIVSKTGREIGFDDVIGQEKAKESLRESVILPTLR